uniref:Uncharacterized protein n=1 Tax=Anopheles coluzzii TaxID=1518534 RepID=A0A8W7PLY4_ANOCL
MRSICESTMSGVEERVMSGVLMPEVVFASSASFSVSTTTFGKGDVGFGDESDVSIPELLWPKLIDLEALSVLPCVCTDISPGLDLPDVLGVLFFLFNDEVFLLFFRLGGTVLHFAMLLGECMLSVFESFLCSLIAVKHGFNLTHRFLFFLELGKLLLFLDSFQRLGFLSTEGLDVLLAVSTLDLAVDEVTVRDVGGFLVGFVAMPPVSAPAGDVSSFFFSFASSSGLAASSSSFFSGASIASSRLFSLSTATGFDLSMDSASSLSELTRWSAAAQRARKSFTSRESRAGLITYISSVPWPTL